MRGVSLVQSSPGGGDLQLARIYRTNVGEYVQEVSSLPSGSFSLLCFLLLTTLCVSQGWRVGLLLVIVGASPGLAIIGLFRSQIRQGEVSIKTISDLFTFGATVSVSTALILEGFIFGRIFDIGSDLELGYSCVVELPLYMLTVLIKYIISVGLVEESCKLMGLLTLKPHVEDLNYRESFLSHYVHSNFGFVIGGVSSSLGFALIENIAYLSNSTENILLMILIGIARTFLSVPFHISASGYSCIILSRYIFSEDDLHGSRGPEPTSTPTVLPFGILKKTLAVSRAVLPVALLHGIYDSSLAILVLLEQDGETGTIPEPELKQTRGWLFSSLSRLAALSPRHFGAKRLIASLKKHGSLRSPLSACMGPVLRDMMGIGFLVVSVVSLLLCISLFVHSWQGLERRTCSRRVLVGGDGPEAGGSGVEVELGDLGVRGTATRSSPGSRSSPSRTGRWSSGVCLWGWTRRSTPGPACA